MAIEKARAAEADDREILHFSAVEADALKLYSQQKACHAEMWSAWSYRSYLQTQEHTLPCVQNVRPSEFSMLAQPTARAC